MNKAPDKEQLLTSYVLGELSEQEAKAIEEEMAKDPILRQEAFEIKEMCRLLGKELAGEEAPELASTQRDKIMAATNLPARKPLWNWKIAFPALAAAGIAGMVFVNQGGFDRALTDSSGDAIESTFVAAENEQQVDAQPSSPKRDARQEERSKEGKKNVAKTARKDKEYAPPATSTKSEAVAKSIAQPAPSKKQGGPMLGRSQDGSLRENKLAKRKSRDRIADFKSSGIAGKPAVGIPGGKSVTYAPAEKAPMGLVAPPIPKPAPVDADMADDALLETPGVELYEAPTENPFYDPRREPLSTFSADVDTASYANIRRMIKSGQRPPADAVRIEEMLNYFEYNYPLPEKDRPFKAHVEVGPAPWQPKHRLVRVGIRGKPIAWDERPAANLVFLLDVSGSMNAANKLPLLKQSLKLLVDELQDQDRVAIVVYAGAAGVVLKSTPVSERQTILDALDRLSAGGSTNGGEGINVAYRIAEKNFVKDGINRVLLATDGDFNVGTTGKGDLVKLVQKKARKGTFLTVLGFGMGNYKDAILEAIANKGNGNYAYIDSEKEAEKVLIEQVGGTLMTIAKDVKFQVEFNPKEVQAYRLIGYENRILAHQDFNDDTKDAGEIGAGHMVTALYEVVPPGVKFEHKGIDDLKYQKNLAEGDDSGELMTLKIRYKEPKGTKSNLIAYGIKDNDRKLDDTSEDFRFAASVAGFGMILKNSAHANGYKMSDALRLAKEAKGTDVLGYRDDFIDLVKQAKKLP